MSACHTHQRRKKAALILHRTNIACNSELPPCSAAETQQIVGKQQKHSWKHKKTSWGLVAGVLLILGDEDDEENQHSCGGGRGGGGLFYSMYFDKEAKLLAVYLVGVVSDCVLFSLCICFFNLFTHIVFILLASCSSACLLASGRSACKRQA